MDIAMVGLGRMGFNMSLRLLEGKHRVVVYDVNPQAVKDLAAQGAVAAADLKDVVSKLPSPKVVWMMLPGQFVQPTIDTLAPLLGKGDVLIDGGNSKFTEAQRRSKALGEKGIAYLDAGTSGGL